MCPLYDYFNFKIFIFDQGILKLPKFGNMWICQCPSPTRLPSPKSMTEKISSQKPRILVAKPREEEEIF
jgi:hypothetical protein